MLYELFVASQTILMVIFVTSNLWQTGVQRDSLKQQGIIVMILSLLFSGSLIGIALWGTIQYSQQLIAPSWFRWYLMLAYGFLLSGVIFHMLVLNTETYKNFQPNRVQWISYGLIMLCSALAACKLVGWF